MVQGACLIVGRVKMGLAQVCEIIGLLGRGFSGSFLVVLSRGWFGPHRFTRYFGHLGVSSNSPESIGHREAWTSWGLSFLKAPLGAISRDSISHFEISKFRTLPIPQMIRGFNAYTP